MDTSPISTIFFSKPRSHPQNRFLPQALKLFPAADAAAWREEGGRSWRNRDQFRITCTSNGTIMIY